MNDDDADFQPSQSTRPRSSENPSLVYTPPKSPRDGNASNSSNPSSTSSKKGSSSRSLTDKLEVIIAKSIQLYKLENDNYVSEGTAGLAIVGNHDLHLYQIILYKNNDEHISKTQVSTNFIFTVLENNYASFYDGAKQNWSTLFSSTEDVQEFATQVAVAKYNSQVKHAQMIIQDLLPLRSSRTKKKDVVELVYSCSMLKKGEVIPFKEKTKIAVELSQSNIFPWHEALKDCSENGRRVVIVPKNLSAPWTNDIESRCSLLVEFEIESVVPQDSVGVSEQSEEAELLVTRRPTAEDLNAGTDQSSSAKTRTEKPVTVKLVKPNVTQEDSPTDSSAEEEPCRAKMTSLKDSLFLSRSHRTNLISRIAKMSQALPVRASPSGHNEPEKTTTVLQDDGPRQVNKLRAVSNAVQLAHQNIPMHFRSLLPHTPHSGLQQTISTSSGPVCKYEIDVSWQQPPMTSGGGFGGQQMCPLTTGPPETSGNESCRMPNCESAATAGELKMSIHKIAEKVDHVLNKLQILDTGSIEKIKEQQSGTLDPMSIISSIQNIIAENEILREKLQKHKERIAEQNTKIKTLTQKSHRCPDDDRPTCSLARTTCQPDHRLTEATVNISHLAAEMEKYRKELSRNKKQISQHNSQIRDLMAQLKEKDELLHHLEAELGEVIAENEALGTGSQFQRKPGGTGVAIPRRRDQESAEDPTEEIKKVMNVVNKKLQSHFEAGRSYSGNDIKDKTADTIRDVTMEYLKYKSMQRPTARQGVESAELFRDRENQDRSSQRKIPLDESSRPSDSITEKGAEGGKGTVIDGNAPKIIPAAPVEGQIKDGYEEESAALAVSEIGKDQDGLSQSRVISGTEMARNVADVANRIMQTAETFGKSASERLRRGSSKAMKEEETEGRSVDAASNKSGVTTLEQDEENVEPVSSPSRVARGSRGSSVLRPSSALSARFQSSGTDRNLRGDQTYASLSGLATVNEDEVAERDEIEKSAVNLTETMSNLTRLTINQPSSITTARGETSAIDQGTKEGSPGSSAATTRKGTVTGEESLGPSKRTTEENLGRDGSVITQSRDASVMSSKRGSELLNSSQVVSDVSAQREDNIQLGTTPEEGENVDSDLSVFSPPRQESGLRNRRQTIATKTTGKIGQDDVLQRDMYIPSLDSGSHISRQESEKVPKEDKSGYKNSILSSSRGTSGSSGRTRQSTTETSQSLSSDHSSVKTQSGSDGCDTGGSSLSDRQTSAETDGESGLGEMNEGSEVCGSENTYQSSSVRSGTGLDSESLPASALSELSDKTAETLVEDDIEAVEIERSSVSLSRSSRSVKQKTPFNSEAGSSRGRHSNEEDGLADIEVESANVALSGTESQVANSSGNDSEGRGSVLRGSCVPTFNRSSLREGTIVEPSLGSQGRESFEGFNRSFDREENMMSIKSLVRERIKSEPYSEDNRNSVISGKVTSSDDVSENGEESTNVDDEEKQEKDSETDVFYESNDDLTQVAKNAGEEEEEEEYGNREKYEEEGNRVEDEEEGSRVEDEEEGSRVEDEEEGNRVEDEEEGNRVEDEEEGNREEEEEDGNREEEEKDGNEEEEEKDGNREEKEKDGNEEEEEKDGNEEEEEERENVKTSGSNAVPEMLMINTYYQTWGPSQPPPLPSGTEGESDDSDEEWL